MPEPTHFQKRVYAETAKIPKGKTSTYKAIAQKLNSSPRAVGQALKRNPYSYDSCDFRRRLLKKSFMPFRVLHGTGREAQKKPLRCLLIPCHRVIKSDNTIGGFNGKTSGKEIQRKIKLLKEEGVVI